MSRLELVKPAGLSGKSGTLLHWVKLQDAKLGIFIFIAKSKQTWEWLPFLAKVSAFGCVFVLSALSSPSSKKESSDNSRSLNK